MCAAHVSALSTVGGDLAGDSSAAAARRRSATSVLEIAVPASPAANPTAANAAPLEAKTPRRVRREWFPGSNMWLMAAEEAMEEVGASRYMSTKLTMEPTTRVEKTRSSSVSPKLGRDAMSPSTFALTPMSSSMRTLKGNSGSAETLDRHPSRKIPIGSDGRGGGSGSSLESHPPPEEPPPGGAAPPPPPPPASS
uniref:Uncharacterized protein n=1 Tax=Ananas comosus var. bracteatus TaxID=296719 RepID=A0A6V7PDS7_ANACO|nr:unnamed protein product [Ananas comosus var. bracteatus]